MRPSPILVAMGDSLTAGYGVAFHEAYTELLEGILRRHGAHCRVVNGGVNGETTEGALRRVAWVLRARPAVVIVAVGLNDGLRGLRLAAMRENLERIVRSLQGGGSRVLVAGMRLPSTTAYAKEFADAFPVVARHTRAALMPFLLEGVAGQPAFTQADGLHPNAVGHRMIAEGLWPHLKLLLTQ